MDANRRMRAFLPEGVFVDVISTFCGPEARCPVITAQDRLISHDGFHLTPAGARAIGASLFADTVLAPFGPRR
jgi:hypothetical protein